MATTSGKPLDPMFNFKLPSRTQAKDYSKVVPLYKPKNSPGPAPSPTALSQLKNTIGTKMNYPTGKQGTKQDHNTYSGTYGGKNWIWKDGKATR